MVENLGSAIFLYYSLSNGAEIYWQLLDVPLITQLLRGIWRADDAHHWTIMDDKANSRPDTVATSSLKWLQFWKKSCEN